MLPFLKIFADVSQRCVMPSARCKHTSPRLKKTLLFISQELEQEEEEKRKREEAEAAAAAQDDESDMGADDENSMEATSSGKKQGKKASQKKKGNKKASTRKNSKKAPQQAGSDLTTKVCSAHTRVQRILLCPLPSDLCMWIGLVPAWPRFLLYAL